MQLRSGGAEPPETGTKDGGGVSTGREERIAPASRELAAAVARRRGVPASRGWRR
jgi:hypothetical protein